MIIAIYKNMIGKGFLPHRLGIKLDQGMLLVTLCKTSMLKQCAQLRKTYTLLTNIRMYETCNHTPLPLLCAVSMFFNLSLNSRAQSIRYCDDFKNCSFMSPATGHDAFIMLVSCMTKAKGKCIKLSMLSKEKRIECI